jgi:sugar phosphate isomerase/epimerase
MKFGVGDYGMYVWDGGNFDTEERLEGLKGIGYEGIELLNAVSADDAMYKAACFRRLGMDFAACSGPIQEASISWTAALGKPYVRTDVGRVVNETTPPMDFDTFCRQVNYQVNACARWGLQVGHQNHLGQLVESQKQLETFLSRCPDCGLLLDTAHLAAADGDCLEIVRKYSDRLVAVHLNDWLLTNPDIGLDRWEKRGRFCALGAGNIGLDNAAVMRALVEVGYDGWVFVKDGAHRQDPVKDLAISRQYLRDAGF